MSPGRHRSAAALTTVALTTLLSCESAAPADTVRVGTDVDAESLDPRLQRNTTGYRVVNLIYDGLVLLDTALQPQPDLAASWEESTPTEWIFHLRPHVRFHDGEPLTADDVVFTYRTVLDPALRSPVRTLYTPIQHVDAPNDSTVHFTLRQPYAPFLTYLELGIVPQHLAESGHDLGVSPVGTGPYRMVRWDRGSRIVLTANDDHWAGRPTIPTVDVIVVPDNTARAQAFEAGDLDIIQSPLAPQDIQRLRSDDRFRSRIQPGTAITYFNFNTTTPVLSDPDVRRALAMLIDQRTIIDRIYEGTDTVAFSIFPPTSWAYSPHVWQPSYDPDAADRVLADAGWADHDEDGILDRAGQRLEFRLGTHAEDVNRIQTVEFVQHTLAQHGITANVEISDWASFSVRRDAGDYDVILLGWTQILDPDRVTFEQLHSSGGLNWGGYRNARLDELLARGRATERRADRLPLYREAAEIIARDVPYYILSYQEYQVFYDPRLVGFVPNPRGMLRSLAEASLAQ